MSKTVSIQVSVPYSTIRKTMCLMSGKVWTDEDIEAMTNGEIVVIPTEELEDLRDQVEVLLSSLFIITKGDEK